MRQHVIGRHGFFEPANAQLLKYDGAAARFAQSEDLIGVGHDLIGWTDGFANGMQPRPVFAQMRAANLDLGAAETARLGSQRVIDQRSLVHVKPAALSGV